MDWASVLGTVASICSVSSFVPQAWKVMRTGDTEALSSKMYMLTVTGFAFWTAYGILLGAWPIMATNSICFVLSAYILAKIVLRGASIAEALTTADNPERG